VVGVSRLTTTLAGILRTLNDLSLKLNMSVKETKSEKPELLTGRDIVTSQIKNPSDRCESYCQELTSKPNAELSIKRSTTRKKTAIGKNGEIAPVVLKVRETNGKRSLLTPELATSKKSRKNIPIYTSDIIRNYSVFTDLNVQLFLRLLKTNGGMDQRGRGRA